MKKLCRARIEKDETKKMLDVAPINPLVAPVPANVAEGQDHGARRPVALRPAQSKDGARLNIRVIAGMRGAGLRSRQTSSGL